MANSWKLQLRYSSAPGKCPVVFSLFSGTLHAPIPLKTLLLSALGPMRSLVEVSAIAGNIYRRPDSSIKADTFSAVASLAIMPAQAGDSLKTAVLHLRKSGITAKNVHAQTGVSGSVFSTPSSSRLGTWISWLTTWRSPGGCWGGTPTFLPLSVTLSRGESRLSTKLREAPPSTEYYQQQQHWKFSVSMYLIFQICSISVTWEPWFPEV